jgi:hypothetical protein
MAPSFHLAIFKTFYQPICDHQKMRFYWFSISEMFLFA